MPSALAMRISSTERAQETCRKCTRPPVSAAIWMSRATIVLSAAHGVPESPIRVAANPSFMAPSPDRPGSSAWTKIGSSNLSAYSRLRRITIELEIGRPSSDSATAPPLRSWPNSVSCCPSWPWVTAPTGQSWAREMRRASRSRNSMSGRLSEIGRVLGIGQTPVKPAATAAVSPLCRSSLYSNPGSRRCTCRSIRPGVTT